MILNGRSNLHFLRITENLTAANTGKQNVLSGMAQTAIVGFMKIDKNWRIA
jgi:hypothetical protein